MGSVRFKSIDVEALNVQDKNGTHATLGVTEDGLPLLTLFGGEKGMGNVMLSVDEHGPELALLGGAGKPGAVFFVSQNRSGLAVYDENVKRCAEVFYQ